MEKLFFSSEFNAEYSAVNEITNSGYDTLANSAAGTFEFSTVAATKGKSALDRIAKFNLTTQPSSNNNLLLDKNITTITSALINGAVTLEYSFLAEDYRGNRSAQMKLNGSGWTADSSIVDFRSNGQLYILSTSFGTYSLNKWYRIAATLYENSKTLDVWVNGVKYTKQFTNDFSSMNQFRLTNESVGGSASTPAVSYYDDVRISEGAYNPNYNTVSITASNFVKSNNFKKVAIANGTTADQLLTGITTNAKQKTLFNSTLSTQKTGSTALTQGDVLILLSADGYTTHTYNLTDSFLGFEFYNGATKLTNLQAGTITAKIPISNYNGGVNDTAIVALYEGNALKSVQTQSINAQGSSATYNVNTTVDANATKLTVFVWNGLVELKPILEVPIVITK